ncbi:unnamed protein product [Absidia cylindrospora]
MKHRQHLQPSAPITYPTRYQELCNETQSNSFDKEDSDTMQRLRKLKQHRNQPMALHATEFDNLVKELNSAKSTKELIGSLIRSLKYLLFAQVSTYDHNNPDKELSIGEAIKLEQNVYDHPSLSDSLMNNQYQQSAPQQNSQSVPEEDVDMGHVKRGNRHHNNNTNGNKNNRQINTGTPTYAFSALNVVQPKPTSHSSFQDDIAFNSTNYIKEMNDNLNAAFDLACNNHKDNHLDPTPNPFSENDLVLLFNTQMTNKQHNRHRKLLLDWIGQYIITKVNSPTTDNIKDNNSKKAYTNVHIK